jgi:hypothetical protein
MKSNLVSNQSIGERPSELPPLDLYAPGFTNTNISKAITIQRIDSGKTLDWGPYPEVSSSQRISKIVQSSPNIRAPISQSDFILKKAKRSGKSARKKNKYHAPIEKT